MPYDPARTVSDDPDFLEGLNSVVAVEWDRNQSGGPASRLGGLAPYYVPAADYTGLDAEPVRVVFKRASNYKAQDDRPGALARGRVLFGASIRLDVNNRLVYRDPDTGQTRYLYVEGVTDNAHGMNHHWDCDFTEYVA